MFNSSKIIVITGPTAVGKTEVALSIAEHFNGEIINADASQFKRGLNIGTAKTDFSRASVPHHFFDIIEPEENYSVYHYQKEGRKLIDRLLPEGKTPVITGGSGLYINALLFDYRFTAPPRHDKSRDHLTNSELASMLSQDNDIPVNNRRRLIRALERKEAGETLGKRAERKALYPVSIICLTRPRFLLYRRIDDRVEEMIDSGWIDECRTLADAGIDLGNVTAIGYREIGRYLKGEITLNEAEETIKKQTRHYAKRQMTWFRHQMPCHFLEITDEDPQAITNKIIALIEGER